MMDKRRTIAFKLNPDVNQTDKIVCDTLDSIPQGERSRLNRAARQVWPYTDKIPGPLSFYVSC